MAGRNQLSVDAKNSVCCSLVGRRLRKVTPSAINCLRCTATLSPAGDNRPYHENFEFHRHRLAEIEAEMKAVRPEAGITAEQYFHVPGLRPEENGKAEAMVRRLTGENATNVVSYGTEAGQFQERGYSAVICGPGDIAQAHQPNEYITVDQFRQGEAFISRLVDMLAE